MTISRVNYFEHSMNVVNGGSLLEQLQSEVKRGTASWNAGSLGYVNSDGEFIAGLGSSGYAMPLWTKHASDDKDLDSEVGGSNLYGTKMNVWAASLGLEIWTTEYKSGSTYACNTLLKAGSTAGQVDAITASNYNDEQIVGQVSRGAPANDSVAGTTVLYFWMLHIPAVKITTA